MSLVEKGWKEFSNLKYQENFVGGGILWNFVARHTSLQPYSNCANTQSGIVDLDRILYR